MRGENSVSDNDIRIVLEVFMTGEEQEFPEKETTILYYTGFEEE